MRARLAGLGVASTLLAAAALPAAAPPLSDGLRTCAAILDATQRLGCYDQLAGRAAPAPTPPPVVHEAPERAPPAASAPTAGAPGSFGLYAAEHPTAPLSPTLTAKVLSIGKAASGRPTLALEGDQLWELERADPLLAAGDIVTIRRGAFGSFTLTTAQGRSYKAKRLH